MWLLLITPNQQTLCIETNIFYPECALSNGTKISRACEFLSTIFKDTTTTLLKSFMFLDKMIDITCVKKHL